MRPGVGLRAAMMVTMTSTLVACAAASDSDGDADDVTHAATSAARTPEADVVLRNLQSFDFGSVDAFDHRVILGQQDADISNRASYGTKITGDVERLTGHAPALVSYELSNVDRGATSLFDVDAFRAGRGAMHDLILEQHRRGALVSLVWHMRCPKASPTDNDLYSPDRCPRDYNLDSLRNGGAHFREWRAMLDEVAELLWSLKDDDGKLIPVLIRPFHEYTGNWFWWGRQNSANSYATAWREMVTYLRDGRGLHNLLWVFCPNTPSDTWSWDSYYPGDDFVDVVGFDRYDHRDGDFASGYEADLRTIGRFADAHHKVAAVTEVGIDLDGTMQSIDSKWFTRSMLAPLESYHFGYVALWRNAPWEKFVPEPGDGALASDFVTMANSPAALLSGKHNLYSPLHAQ